MTCLRGLLVLALLLPRLAAACETPVAASSVFDSLCAEVSGTCPEARPILILSAFPYEQRDLRAATDITERGKVLGRTLLRGRLAGRPVLMALTQIGLANATILTEAVLARYDVRAIVFSGVAGSVQRIADVAVPGTWSEQGKPGTYTPDPELMAAARAVAASGIHLQNCQAMPPGADVGTRQVCFPYEPRVVVGGVGESNAPFGILPCQPDPVPGLLPIFGCESRPAAAAAVAATRAVATAPGIGVPQGAGGLDAVDEESGAVARVATAHGVPFVVVRGVSDGPGDPLGLPGFPTQFFTYYPISADNAAAVAAAIVANIPNEDSGRGRTTRARPGAACGFARAVTSECSAPPPARVAKLVAGACALRARAADVSAAKAAKLVSQAAARWRQAADAASQSGLATCCADALAARLRAAADASDAGQGAAVR